MSAAALDEWNRVLRRFLAALQSDGSDGEPTPTSAHHPAWFLPREGAHPSIEKIHLICTSWLTFEHAYQG